MRESKKSEGGAFKVFKATPPPRSYRVNIVSLCAKTWTISFHSIYSIYIDNLFKELKQLGLGCHVGPTFAGAFGYADDVALIAPSLYALKKMISLCESYAEHHLQSNQV